MSKIRKILTAFIFINFVFCVFTLRVNAQEAPEDVSITEMNQVMTMQTGYDAREYPVEEAPTVYSYSEGDSVWVIGETQDGWYKTSYQGKEGYIPTECITGLQIEVEGEGTVELTETELDGEMAEIEAESKMLVEEVERQRAEKKRSRIWIVVIVILVIAIFATGIISVTRKGKKNDSRNKENNQKDNHKKDDHTGNKSLQEKDDFDIIDLDSNEE